MGTVTMKSKILHVAKTLEQWEQYNNLVISRGFLCVIYDGDNTTLKIGDGVTTFANLPVVGKEVDLSSYYTKTETDTAITTAVNAAVSGMFVIKGRVDTTADLPTTGNKNGYVYLVGLEGSATYEEWYWTGTAWDFLGNTIEVDLSDYYKKEQVDALLENKVDKVSGKGLSTNDFTNVDKAKLDSLENYDDTALSQRVTAIEDDYVKSTDTLVLNCTL